MERPPRPGTGPPDPSSVVDLVRFDAAGRAFAPGDVTNTVPDPLQPGKFMKVPVALSADELDTIIANQYDIRSNPPGIQPPGFLPSEKKIDPKTGRAEREDYESPFEEEVPVQYTRTDGTTRLGTEWNYQDSKGELMYFGHQHMDQEYIVTMGQVNGGTEEHKYYIFGTRVYDLTAAEQAGQPEDFREFPSTIPLHHVVRGDDGSDMPPRRVGRHVPSGKIGEEWLDARGESIFPDDGTRDPNDPMVMTKVEVRGAIEQHPVPTANRPNRGSDPFEAVDDLIPLELRTQPRQPGGEVRSDRRPTPVLRQFGRWLMNGTDDPLPERRYSDDGSRMGDRIGHNIGRDEWERMDSRRKRELALQRVYTMVDALSQVSTPEIETEIEITQPRLAGHPKIARAVGLRRTAIDPAQVGFGQTHPDKKTDRSVKVDRTKGWAFSFKFEGDQISIKNTDPNRNRDPDLFIEKPEPDKKPRSWMGGMETLVPGVPARGRRQRPRLVAVGSRMGSYGQYGSSALERWTRSDKPEGDNSDVEATKLIALGNELYRLAQETVTPGTPNPMDGIIDPWLRPAAFRFTHV